MTSLDELKRKWFIDTADERPFDEGPFGEGSFPPQARHPGSLLDDHSDGNLVTPLIDPYAGPERD